jgi:hypothetical protein
MIVVMITPATTIRFIICGARELARAVAHELNAEIQSTCEL